MVDTSSIFYKAPGKTARMRSDIVKKILTMSQQHHLIRNVYKETRDALLNIFNSLEYIDDEDKIIAVKCFPSNPERAIAKITQKDNLVLPVITISQSTSNNSNERQRYTPILVHEKYWDDDKQRAIRILSLAPRPINIMYDIALWDEYIMNLDQLMEQIRLYFNPSLNIATKSNTLIKAFIEDESNESNYNVGDGSDRLVRKLVTIKVETYITNPKYLVTSTGQIERFYIESHIKRLST